MCVFALSLVMEENLVQIVQKKKFSFTKTFSLKSLLSSISFSLRDFISLDWPLAFLIIGLVLFCLTLTVFLSGESTSLIFRNENLFSSALLS